MSSIITGIGIFLIYLQLYGKPRVKGVRYRLLCRSCGWEWLSKTTTKGVPDFCPNCNKPKIEVLDTIDPTQRRDLYYRREPYYKKK